MIDALSSAGGSLSGLCGVFGSSGVVAESEGAGGEKGRGNDQDDVAAESEGAGGAGNLSMGEDCGGRAQASMGLAFSGASTEGDEVERTLERTPLSTSLSTASNVFCRSSRSVSPAFAEPFFLRTISRTSSPCAASSTDPNWACPLATLMPLMVAMRSPIVASPCARESTRTARMQGEGTRATVGTR